MLFMPTADCQRPTIVAACQKPIAAACQKLRQLRVPLFLMVGYTVIAVLT